MTEPRVLFAGTPDFARASLAALVDSGTMPIAVLTQPDRRAGRGKKLTASPVKQYALERGIDVLQPATLKDVAAVETLTALKPDVMIVAAYGLILPQAVLDVPTEGCLNVHASILPRWRGAAPVQAAILAGDAETGISLMAMTAGLDTGPVFAVEAIDIGPRETAGELHDRLAELGGRLLLRHLEDILAGNLKASAQDDKRASYAGKIRTADAELDWRQPAAALDRAVRAYNPVPGAWFMRGEERLKVGRASVVDGSSARPGTIVDAADFTVACGDGALRLEEIQRPGRRSISGREFAVQVSLGAHDLVDT